MTSEHHLPTQQPPSTALPSSLAELSAYLQPAFELAIKLSPAIPLWLLLVMADKHFLGLSLLKGSVWRSPRIPPTLSLKASLSKAVSSCSKFDRYSSAGSAGDLAHKGTTLFGPSALNGSFDDSTKLFSRSSQVPLLFSNSRLVGASAATTLSVYQPLEVHYPFKVLSRGLELGYAGCVVLLVLVIAFLGFIMNGCWNPFGKRQLRKSNDIEAPSPDPIAEQGLTEKTGLSIYWDSTSMIFGMTSYTNSSEHSFEQPNRTSKPLFESLFADTPTESEDALEQNLDQSNSTHEPLFMSLFPDTVNTETRVETTENAEKGQEEMTTDMERAKIVERGESQKIEASLILVLGMKKKKKQKRIRQNAKRRAAKRVTAEEAEREVVEALIASAGDARASDDDEGRLEKAKPNNRTEAALNVVPEQKRKKTRRQRSRKHKVMDRALQPDHSFSENTMPKIDQRDEAQVRRMPIVVAQSENSIVLDEG